ncbi:hypothetical protein [Bernardetia sp.]|uniref:hypothetical protein n=1 Tax=Bernardetia sp. TaxID=1937974 RepID=UPI0025C62712|nr:hypothetical protein [Bernardetia sp.]
MEENLKEEFEKFLQTKKISVNLFKNAEKERFEEWQRLFSHVHPKSFVIQKLHLINEIRRKYHIDKEI